MSQFQFNPSIAPLIYSQLQSSLLKNMQDSNCTTLVSSIEYLWKLRNILQDQVLKLQLNAVLNGVNLAQPIYAKETTTITTSPTAKSSLNSPSVISTVNSEYPATKTEVTEITNSLPDDPDICLEAQIKYMVQFFVNQFGRVTESDVQAERRKYVHDSKLIKIFDALVAKYTATTKTREEMIKWVVRRAIKSCRQIIRREQKISPKKITKNLCEKYFRNSTDEIKREEFEEVEEEACAILPFRKNSKNKTMNASFISEIFASEDFRADYQIFLSSFDTVTDKDTIKKSGKFISFLVDCVKKDSVKGIIKYKRIPWLKLWVLNTKKVAIELESGTIDQKTLKKIKMEDDEEDL